MEISNDVAISVAMLPGSLSRLAGGLYTSVRRLSESLRDTGQSEVSVIGHHDEFTDEDLVAWKSPRPYVIRGTTTFGRTRNLMRKVGELQPNILHYHFLWSYASLASRIWKLTKNRSRHLVISTRGMLDPWALENSRWRKRIASVLCESSNLNSADCIHALSMEEAAAIRSYGVRSPICVIPNGVDVARIDADTTVDGRSRMLLFLGRIHRKKGLVNLIQAWSDTRAIMQNWNLVIAGWDDGAHEAKLRRLVADLGLNSHVVFAGPKMNEDKLALLRSATAFVLPSLSEGLPMAVLEAWSIGLPVLITDNCNLPTGFSAGAAIKIAPTRESIAAGLNRLALMSREDLSSMGAHGRRLVEREFAWPNAATSMLRVYKWILGKEMRPDCVITE